MPYTRKEEYWLVDINDGDVYRINNRMFEFLSMLENRVKVKAEDSAHLIEDLSRINAIENG